MQQAACSEVSGPIDRQTGRGWVAGRLAAAGTERPFLGPPRLAFALWLFVKGEGEEEHAP